MPGKPNPERSRILSEWSQAFGSPPPPFLSVDFMERALAYEDQCRKLGGLSARVRRELVRHAGDKCIGVAHQPRLQSGAHLVRE